MNTQSNNRKFVNIILHIIGYSLCVLPPAICTLAYFPLWNEVGAGKVISGGAALLTVLSLIPLIRFIRRALFTGASYWMWLIIFVAFLALGRIADEMTVIAFYGFIGNILGAVFIGKARKNK